MRCGEKWAPGHRCAPQVQLHVLKEVWNLCESCLVEDEDSQAAVSSPEDPSTSHQLCLLLSSAAMSDTSSPRTIQLQGSIAGLPITILVDSGSTHSFLSSSVAAKLSGVQPLPQPVPVRVADGSVVSCSASIPSAEWSTHGYSFHSSLKILPLGSFDLILGMDWLEAFSPMKVHWQQKWMVISYGTESVLLQGLDSTQADCSVIQLFHVASDVSVASEQSSTAIHLDVQSILDQFTHLFTEPVDLPPHRSCDHSIPLISGSQPVSIRRYRYSPSLKSEIEKQVSELLQSGFIRPSTSPFSSPVLLVRKKDHSWWMCIDYRMLNALTVKSKFPIPVIDELLDELSSARWFSYLDLCAGFNQIRLPPGEEFKTAFQTHWGHFEYTVMSFGLTGAPNTFQGP